MFPGGGAVLAALLLVIANGFFVAAEFALIKVRPGQVAEMVKAGRPFAGSVAWLAGRLDQALAACQLGITMASLGLGWVGEPAFARLLEPLLAMAGIESPRLIHSLGFAFAFTTITAIHLVLGEQLPKIFAIRRAAELSLWCAPALRFFYIVAFPLLMALSGATSFLLRVLGVEDEGHGDTPQTDDEIRLLLTAAHEQGNLTRSEHRLMHAAMEFDDAICRRVMVPRSEVDFIDIDESLETCLELARRAKHTRFPVCDGSLDTVLGIVHLKDLLTATVTQGATLRSILRPPQRVPDTMLISRLLRHFQVTRQHMALVVDEYGTVIGIVTLENVIEEIVGPVEDEFDAETPDVVPENQGSFLVNGAADLEDVSEALNLELTSDASDTLSGLLTDRLGRIVRQGDVVVLPGAVATVLEARGSRARQVRIQIGATVDADGRVHPRMPRAE
jgi:CBS domain containing-hemolysin-like protein